jgi:hypothetical protein
MQIGFNLLVCGAMTSAEVMANSHAWTRVGYLLREHQQE